MNRFQDVIPRLSGRVLITGHVNPDGDAVGSCLAMHGVVRALGGSPTLYSQDPFAPEFDYLDHFSEVQGEPGRLDQYDTLLVLDTGSTKLLGEAVQKNRPFTIVLDHHRTREPFGDLEVVDADASAVGVIIADLITEAKLPMTRAIARPLWCSIFSDTGGFRYGSTDARTLALGERLLRAGVDPWETAQALYESNPLGRIKLLGLALSTIELREEGRAAGLYLDRASVKASGHPLSLSSGFVNYGRSIRGVEISFFVRPVMEDPDLYRVSFRSRGTYPVDEIAEAMGGGGHRNAAGCRVIADSASHAKELVFAAIHDTWGSK